MAGGAVPRGADTTMVDRLRGFSRQALHAAKLQFQHPRGTKLMSYSVRCPRISCNWPRCWLTMQLDYPSVAAVWSEPQENVIGFTTTNRGLSGGDGTMAVADRAAAHNRQLLGKALARANHGQNVGIQWVQQTHGTANVYASVVSAQQLPVADAMWTDQPGVALAIQTADCVLVLFGITRCV